MTDRDRFIELLSCVSCKAECCSARDGDRCGALDDLDRCQIETIADHLIANGVILQPCKVGDTVYIPKDDGTISESKVARIDVTFMMDTGKNTPFDTWWLNEYNLGITSFLTRE